VSWFLSSDRFELFSNRDEQRGRGREQGPRIHARGETRFLAPLDSEAGGSWVTANEHGVALCLLNLYQAQGSIDPVESRSRGLLVLELADCEGLGELSRRLSARQLGVYQPFSLLGLEPGRPAQLIEWNGRDCRTLESTCAPLVSSSVDLGGARRTREELYAAVEGAVDQRAAHLAFHASHAQGPGPRSVCMHRDDAETRSLIHVVVEAGEVTMRHGAGSPCRTPLGDPLRLLRRAPLSTGL